MGKKEYFSGLNYTLGNEDSSVEVEMVKKLKPKKVFAVCGSGGRSLSLLNEETSEIALSDLSKEQLLLAKLRLATYRQLPFEKFSLFWGYFPYHPKKNRIEREIIMSQLTLDDEVRNFFKRVFEELEFASVLYTGKWERTFAFFSKVNQRILGKNFRKIFEFKTLEEQVNYYKNGFPLMRWKVIISILGNKTMFNALLYKGSFIQKNSPLSHFDYYFNAFDRLFTRDIARKSFFLNLCFFGSVNYLEGVPVEASEAVFKDVAASKGEVKFINQDMITHLESGEKKYDFLSLSDVPSYFSGDLERLFMQKIKNGLNPEAIVVVRYYLKTCECDLSGYEDVSNLYKKEIDAEKVQMYNIKIYKYVG